MRVGELSGTVLRLVEEVNAGATAPEQLSRFQALLLDAKATVKVRDVNRKSVRVSRVGCVLTNTVSTACIGDCQ